MTRARKDYGDAGEQTAYDYLRSQGFKPLARNVATPYGEIDLLMEEGGERVVVEVKARHTTSHGAPQEAVTSRKLDHLAKAAELHFRETNYTGPWRIDVVAISGTHLEHFRNVTLA